MQLVWGNHAVMIEVEGEEAVRRTRDFTTGEFAVTVDIQDSDNGQRVTGTGPAAPRSVGVRRCRLCPGGRGQTERKE